jgi:hypothetical protein
MSDYLTAREACAYLPARPHINSVRRWMSDGCNGIRLRSVRFGGKRLTTAQWCDEFVAAVTKANGATDDHLKAEAQLDRLGV